MTVELAQVADHVDGFDIIEREPNAVERVLGAEAVYELVGPPGKRYVVLRAGVLFCSCPLTSCAPVRAVQRFRVAGELAKAAVNA